MANTAKTAAGDATSGPQVTRMICKPNHRFKRQAYGPGDEITASPVYINLMDEQGVLVPEGYEAKFSQLLDEAGGNWEGALDDLLTQKEQDGHPAPPLAETEAS